MVRTRALRLAIPNARPLRRGLMLVATALAACSGSPGPTPDGGGTRDFAGSNPDLSAPDLGTPPGMSALALSGPQSFATYTCAQYTVSVVKGGAPAPVPASTQ